MLTNSTTKTIFSSKTRSCASEHNPFVIQQQNIAAAHATAEAHARQTMTMMQIALQNQATGSTLAGPQSTQVAGQIMPSASINVLASGSAIGSADTAGTIAAQTRSGGVPVLPKDADFRGQSANIFASMASSANPGNQSINPALLKSTCSHRSEADREAEQAALAALQEDEERKKMLEEILGNTESQEL